MKTITLNIEIPDDVLDLVKDESDKLGYESVESYLRDLIDNEVEKIEEGYTLRPQ